MTAFKRSQAKHGMHSYGTTNWPEYEAGLRRRGSLTVWISEDEREAEDQQQLQPLRPAEIRAEMVYWEVTSPAARHGRSSR